MSLVPSKRIDRVFPIVPPLCLLLAAIVAACREKERWRLIVDRSCAVAIILSVVSTGGYTTRKIVLASREQRDPFAVVGRAGINKAAGDGWRHPATRSESDW